MKKSKTGKKQSRPRLAVVKFASCDGCQLSVLNMEDDLLALGQALEIAYFPEASSRMQSGPYDIVLVEGSITTPEDARRVAEIREQTKSLITIGACATAGGIQALRNWSDIEAFKRAVYPSPEYIQSLSTSTPISEHVHVDYELWGCPIDKLQLLSLLTDLVRGVQPRHSTHSVCMECKRPGERVRHGRQRYSLSRSCDSHRLRSDLSEHGKRVLWLLWANGGSFTSLWCTTEYPIVGQSVSPEFAIDSS